MQNKEQNAPTWYKESYEIAIVQRNVLAVLVVLCLLGLIASALLIKHIKNTESIEPFVVEIDSITGIPTVVKSVPVEEYSTSVAMKRALVMQYIRAREEYIPQTFRYQYKIVVPSMSSPDSYDSYVTKNTPSNPQSPSAVYGEKGIITVDWKSIVFLNDNTAQVRINVNYPGKTPVGKLVLVAFEFKNNRPLSAEQALANPLNFYVTLYRVTDENA
ncbi:Type IV secretion system protein VirB8 [Candidatus Fokinia solitaria]|uniref:Type IV secretion system protein VirB8 n=1 Tax=Candidatus Fokinia solitaria TaxID=1802984 RepID=A0A2U8BSZ8_9RICK|nr:type IV secretion system protein [Candidatus Fokinia solitaria]AWD33435.1 Type IV secretion system protein VirB8 [Candidatus Fokinia solitaria]